MPVAVEIVYLPSSEAFRQNHALFDPVLKYVSSADGNLGAYYGFLEEDPNEAYMIVVWKTVEHHRVMMNDPEVYPRLLEAVKDCVVAPVRMYHVLLEPASTLAAVLNSPITSFHHITELAGGATSDDDNGLVNVSEVSTFGTPSSSTPSAFCDGCFGKVIENNEFIALRGWNSSADFEAASRERAGEEAEHANLRVVKTVHTKLAACKVYQG